MTPDQLRRLKKLGDYVLAVDNLLQLMKKLAREDSPSIKLKQVRKVVTQALAVLLMLLSNAKQGKLLGPEPIRLARYSKTAIQPLFDYPRC